MTFRSDDRRLRRVGALLVSALLAAGLVSILMNLGAKASAQDPPAATPASDQRLTDAFGLLRRPVSAADEVPARWRNQLMDVPADLARGEVPPDITSARKVTTSVGATFWVMKRGDSLCVLEAADDGAGFGCSGIENVLAGRSYAVSSGVGYGLAAGETRISGLLPDGASDVRVATRNGVLHSVAVQQNVYVAVVRGEVDHVDWLDAQNAPRTVPIQLISPED
jgi:hypothetical protein